MPSLEDVTDILFAYRPNRKVRKGKAGARCTLCGLGIVAVDFAYVEVERDGYALETRAIHTACTALLAEEVERLRGVADEMEAEG